jgi:hypothetical protein
MTESQAAAYADLPPKVQEIAINDLVAKRIRSATTSEDGK